METQPEATKTEALQLSNVFHGLELPSDQTKALLDIFTPYAEKTADLLDLVDDINVEVEGDEDGQKAAREMRLQLRAIRIECEKTRKREKQYILVSGRAVDAIANAIKSVIEPLEERMKGFEEFDERLKAERLANLRTEREGLLRPWLPEDAEMPPVEMMTQGMFDQYLQTAKDQFEKAEKEEAARVEAERKEKEEQAAALKKLQEENAQLQAEKEAAAKEAAALKAQEEARQIAAAQKQKEAEALANGPDIDKITQFITDLKLYKEENLPSLESEHMINKLQVISMNFDRFIDFAKGAIEQLQ